jgi:hypothetical protein
MPQQSSAFAFSTGGVSLSTNAKQRIKTVYTEWYLDTARSELKLKWFVSYVRISKFSTTKFHENPPVYFRVIQRAHRQADAVT